MDLDLHDTSDLSVDSEPGEVLGPLAALHPVTGLLHPGTPRLSRAEEVSLGERIATARRAEEALAAGVTARRRRTLDALVADGRAAEDRFVTANVRLVQMVVAECGALSSTTRQDLFQEGMIGLLQAVRRWEPERGHTFATYGLFWVRRRVRDGLDAQDLMLGRRGLLLRRQAGTVEDELRQQLHREPTLAEVAAELGRSPSDVQHALRWGVVECHDDQLGVVEEDALEEMLSDTVADRRSADWCGGSLSADQLIAMLGDPLRAQVLSDRIGLGGEVVSYREIARRHGRSPHWVRRVEQDAVAELRRIWELRAIGAAN